MCKVLSDSGKDRNNNESVITPKPRGDQCWAGAYPGRGSDHVSSTSERDTDISRPGCFMAGRLEVRHSEGQYIVRDMNIKKGMLSRRIWKWTPNRHRQVIRVLYKGVGH